LIDKLLLFLNYKVLFAVNICLSSTTQYCFAQRGILRHTIRVTLVSTDFFLQKFHRLKTSDAVNYPILFSLHLVNKTNIQYYYLTCFLVKWFKNTPVATSLGGLFCRPYKDSRTTAIQLAYKPLSRESDLKWCAGVIQVNKIFYLPELLVSALKKMAQSMMLSVHRLGAITIPFLN
jgi:hypothetical protein